MPIEPEPTPWVFADLRTQRAEPALEDLVAVGADLEPGTLLAAYRHGYFPMPGDRPGDLLWFSPVQRGVLPLDGLVVSRSLRRSVRDFEIRVDTAFDEVIAACADPERPQGWIDDAFREAYARLHRLGWAHSVEAWQQGRLVGGLYGVGIGGLFAGESMFHRVRDASKVALVGLVDLLLAGGDGDRRLLDVQWQTPHLASLGVVRMPRRRYLERLPVALACPAPAGFEPRSGGGPR